MSPGGVFTGCGGMGEGRDTSEVVVKMGEIGKMGKVGGSLLYLGESVRNGEV